LTLIIPGGATRDMNDSDLTNLIQTYNMAEEAKDAFLQREITFDEYIQLLESVQVNIDGYLETIEANLHSFGV
jgi:c-di-GMP-related signal transduction protein